MELRDLLNLAREVLVQDPASPDIIDFIERYFTAFEDVRDALGEAGASERNLIEELLAAHNAIIEVTMNLKDDTSKSLRDLKKRGRGIMAYTDIFPKRMSLGTLREG